MAAIDDFKDYTPFNAGINAPFSNAFAITPHDTNELAHVTRSLYVGTPGDLVILLVGDASPVTLKNFSGGIDGRVKKVLATGTTAADIVGFY